MKVHQMFLVLVQQKCFSCRSHYVCDAWNKVYHECIMHTSCIILFCIWHMKDLSSSLSFVDLIFSKALTFPGSGVTPFSGHTSKFDFWFTKITFFQVQSNIFVLNCLWYFPESVFVLTSAVFDSQWTRFTPITRHV